MQGVWFLRFFPAIWEKRLGRGWDPRKRAVHSQGMSLSRRGGAGINSRVQPNEHPALWDPARLSDYPMDSNAMVSDLAPDLKSLLFAYVAETTHSETLGKVVEAIARRHPLHLRVKELFENVEAYRRIGQAVYEQWKAGHVDHVYDFACGHGLLGVLLAHRFPKLRVTCVDLERRPAFDHYLETIRESGNELRNIEYLESDFTKVPISPRSFIICIHACNEATLQALQMANGSNACFAAMPCCIRDGIYIRAVNHTDDETRYAVSVGIIAGRFGGYKITAIDPRITNRNLIILGGPEPGDSGG